MCELKISSEQGVRARLVASRSFVVPDGAAETIAGVTVELV